MREPVRPEKAGAAVEFLYRCPAGRLLLKLFSSRPVSSAAGLFLSSPFSRILIRPFTRKKGISLDECEKEEYRCFNDFFCRKVRRECRPVDPAPEALIAPCDGLLSAYTLRGDLVLPVKQSRFSLSSLLAGDEVRGEYEDGLCLVFRLCVEHYHRYCYIDRGVKGENRFLRGKLHTVRPIALENFPVFVENCREYTVIDTENFGRVIQMEVGAMLVGRIHNYHGKGEVRRGQEKGRFLFGGSTVILLFQKDTVALPREVFLATEAGMEVPVKLGERIGTKHCAKTPAKTP